MHNRIVVGGGGVLDKNIDDVDLVLVVGAPFPAQAKGAFELVFDPERNGNLGGKTGKNGTDTVHTAVVLVLAQHDDAVVDGFADDGRFDSEIRFRTAFDEAVLAVADKILVFGQIPDASQDPVRVCDLQRALQGHVQDAVVHLVADVHFGNRLLQQDQTGDLLLVRLEEARVVDDDAHLVGEGQKEVDFLGEELDLPFAPGGDDTDDVVADLQGCTDGRAARRFRQDAVDVGDALVSRRIADGDGLPRPCDTGGQAFVFVAVQRRGEGPLRLFGRVVLHHLYAEVLFCLVEQMNAAPVEADRIDQFVEDLCQHLVEVGLNGQQRADPEDALEQFVLIEKGRRRPWGFLHRCVHSSLRIKLRAVVNFTVSSSAFRSLALTILARFMETRYPSS